MTNKMKHRLPILLFLLLAVPARDAFAQDYPPVPVTVSRSQVNMNGKTYYVHIVLERQTIYGITKAYEVTEADLYAANPMLAQEGLKAGTVIYIPTVSEQKAAPKPAEQEKPAVKEQKPAVVQEQKPAAAKVQPAPKENKPSVVDTKPAPTPDADGFIQHTVKWFEDIYAVAKNYGVTAEEIMAANGLKSSRISKRQTLRIPYTDKAKESLKSLLPAVTEPAGQKPAQAEPVRAEVPAQAENPVVEQPAPVVAKPEEAAVPEPENGILDWLTGATGNGKAELALILPFNAAGKASETNMDFYSGVLMALRDLEKEGVKTTLNVFDLQAGIPSSYDLGKNDFVLGPITTRSSPRWTSGPATWPTRTKGSSRRLPPPTASTPTWRPGRPRTASGATRSSW